MGVNISGNPLVRAGLQGKEASRMTQWKDTIALSASSPIHSQDKVVGVMLTGLLIDRVSWNPCPAPGPRWPSSSATAWWSIPLKTCRKAP